MSEVHMVILGEQGLDPIIFMRLLRVVLFSMSAVMMLEHIGEHKVADRVSRAIHDVLGARRHVTKDLGGTADTATFTQALIDAL